MKKAKKAAGRAVRASAKKTTAAKKAPRASETKKASTRPKAKSKLGAKAKASARPAKKAMAARRADYGAPIDGFFAKQAPPLRPVLEELRGLVESAVPRATAALKWGMPFYSLGGQPVCALAGFKSHVNLILAGPAGTVADPKGLLEGDGKTGKHLKLRSLEELPRAAVKGWLKSAAKLAEQRGAR